MHFLQKNIRKNKKRHCQLGNLLINTRFEVVVMRTIFNEKLEYGWVCASSNLNI